MGIDAPGAKRVDADAPGTEPPTARIKTARMPSSGWKSQRRINTRDEAAQAPPWMRGLEPVGGHSKN